MKFIYVLFSGINHKDHVEENMSQTTFMVLDFAICMSTTFYHHGTNSTMNDLSPF